MRPERWQRIEELYHAAPGAPPDRRGALLAEACAGDAELLAEVESLLAQEGLASVRMDGLARGLGAGLLDESAAPLLDAGKTLAHYRIHGKVGEGGMGEVYRADRARPLGRSIHAD